MAKWTDVCKVSATDVEKRIDTIKGDISRLKSAAEKMDKATLDRLVQERKKELAAVAAQAKEVGDKRIAHWKEIDKAKAAEESRAKKVAAEYIQKAMKEFEDKTSADIKLMEATDRAVTNLEYHQKELVKVLEEAAKKKK